MGIFAKNIMIGIFVIVAIALIVFILLFLHPSVGDNAKTLKVRFTNIDKVTLGTRVTYAGKPVGEVISIHELPDARTNRMARNGDVYVYELMLNVDSGVSVFNTDSISVFTSGLLGEKGIEITPEPVKPDEKLILVEKEILYATPARSLDETLQQIEHVAVKLGNVLDNIDKSINEFRAEDIIREAGKVVKEAGQAIHSAHEFTNTLNQPEKWNRMINQLHESLGHFNDLTVRAHHTWDSLDKAAINAHHVTAQFDDLINYVTQGKGTIGRLLMTEDLYLRFKSLFSKAETVMKDINNYGILYQNSKKWQRENAWRHDLLSKLSYPDAFSNYFNNELQRVSNSLNEVSAVLNDGVTYPENLINNDDYGRRYAELLRQVEDLQDSLKMYNQQIVDLNNRSECR